jgi:hypothetical protein
MRRLLTRREQAAFSVEMGGVIDIPTPPEEKEEFLRMSL